MKDQDDEGLRKTLVSYRRGDILIPNLDLREALSAETDHFAQAIAGKPCVSDGAFGLNIVRVLAAADESLQSGRFVELENL